MDDHQVPDRIAEPGNARGHPLEQRGDFRPRAVQALFNEEAAIEYGAATVGHARGLDTVGRLPADDRVHVERGPARALRYDRHRGAPRRERGLQLDADRLQQGGHVVDRAHPEERHAAMGGASVQLHLEPPHAAVPDADAVHAERLRDDDVVGAAACDPARLGEEGHAREAAALLVDGAAHLEGARRVHARPAQGLGRVDGRGEAGLHVAGAPSPDLPVAHVAAEGIHRPAVPGRHHVEVAVEVDERALALARPRPHDVHARMRARVLGPALRRQVLDGEAPAPEPVADHAGALLVALAGGVHGGQPHQLRGEVHHLLRQAAIGGQLAADDADQPAQPVPPVVDHEVAPGDGARRSRLSFCRRGQRP